MRKWWVRFVALNFAIREERLVLMYGISLGSWFIFYIRGPKGLEHHHIIRVWSFGRDIRETKFVEAGLSMEYRLVFFLSRNKRDSGLISQLIHDSTENRQGRDVVAWYLT